MTNNDEHYLGNPLLKKANIPIEFTAEQIEEIGKCYDDPIYFAENYVQIVTLDKGLQPFRMYDFQKNMIQRFHDNRFNIFSHRDTSPSGRDNSKYIAILKKLGGQ